jgi:hypothetical protein
MSLSSSKLIGTATASSKKLHLGILGVSATFGLAATMQKARSRRPCAQQVKSLKGHQIVVLS